MLTAKFFGQGEDSKCFFRGCGSFGEISGNVTRGENSISRETDLYKITCVYKSDDYGVFTRQDVFENTSESPLEVNALKSRFVFEGGEYEVYTQFNTWQNESTGRWLPLVTGVTATGASARTCQDAAPFLVLWSLQEQRGVAFHLLPNAAWEMKVTRVGHYCKYTKVVVELGILDYNLSMTLVPGEQIKLPQILCYEVSNRTDLDCWKLHNYMHTNYPRREMPVIYDTWMYKFDHITYENVSSQIALAAELGVEYFFIDAGWFGKGNSWSNSVGDWEENTTGALCGRMSDIANRVRAAGMKFGIWLEPERAVPESEAVKAHPDYYIPGDAEPEYCFLDFGNEKARSWMLGILFDLIDRYGVAYIKDDYNADMYFDPQHAAYLKYHEGHAEFIQAIRNRYPQLYLSSCASGGERLELNNYLEFDSSWPSDNESPYREMRIYKDTILRLPPQGFERWVAVHSLDGYEPFYEPFKGSNEGKTERLVACGDAVWKHIEGVQTSFLKGYMTCGPIGFSCDLTKLSPNVFREFQSFIASVKENRVFWRTAVARILCDTPSVTTYQYSDMALSQIVIQLFTHQPMQDHFRIYPKVDETKTYCVNGTQILSGKELTAEGITVSTPVWVDNWHEMLEVTLKEVTSQNDLFTTISGIATPMTVF